MGIAKPEAIKSLIMEFYPEIIEDAPLPAIHETFLEIMKTFYNHSPVIREIEGATSTFKKLKSMGIKVGPDTGFSSDITDIIINRLGWHNVEILDVSIASDEVNSGRPAPDMIFRQWKNWGLTM